MPRRRSGRTIGLMGLAVLALAATGCEVGASGGASAPAVPTFSSGTTTTGAEPPVELPPADPPVASSDVAPPAVSIPPAAADPAECTAADLRLGLGQGNAAAGTTYRPLRFTNAGSRTCTIQGFPGVSYVAGDDGHQVGPAAFRVGTKGPVITLAPGRTAHAPVGFTQVRNFDPAVCRPTAVRGLRVYAPHDTAAMFLPMEGTGCAGTPPSHQLVVRTMQSGGGA